MWKEMNKERIMEIDRRKRETDSIWNKDVDEKNADE